MKTRGRPRTAGATPEGAGPDWRPVGRNRRAAGFTLCGDRLRAAVAASRLVGPPRCKSGRPRNPAKESTTPVDRDGRTQRTRPMSDSFARFLAKLHDGDDAARELFGRFTHQLIALA